MAPVWSKGENAPLTGDRFRVVVRAEWDLDLSVLAVDVRGKVLSDAGFVFYNQPTGPGMALRQGTAGQRAVELAPAEIEPGVARLIVAVSLDDLSTALGDMPQAVAELHRWDGSVVGTFPLSGLTTERAVVALELYRRAGAWKVRAVGQGYDGGLAELATVCGVDLVDEAPESTRPPVATPSPPAPQPSWTDPGVSGPTEPRAVSSAAHLPPGLPIHFTPDQSRDTSQLEHDAQERLCDQLWNIFEDAARSAAAFESAVSFAHQRLDRELSDVVSDPSTRNSPEAAAARSTAQRRHDDLVARAAADHQRDSDQLTAEIAEISGTLPAPMASWDSPAWRSWTPPARPVPGLRLGTLSRPSGPVLPFVIRLPLARPLWIDAGGGMGGPARTLAKAMVTRLLAAHPRGALAVDEIDLAHPAADSSVLPWNTRLGSRVTSPSDLTSLLAGLVSRVDLARMAAQGNTGLPGTEPAARLLLWHDFPYGLDDRGVRSTRFLVEEGRMAGVFLVIIADPSDANIGGADAEAVWRSALRLVTEPSDSVGDPWVGLEWTYTPDVVGTSSGHPTVDHLLERLLFS